MHEQSRDTRPRPLGAHACPDSGPEGQRVDPFPATVGRESSTWAAAATPIFLSHTSFAEKFAVDQVADPGPLAGITWHTLDLNSFPTLPFEDGFFGVVTLLAVVEHVDPEAW